MIRSENYPKDSPQYRLMEFLHSWKKGKFKKMAFHCQKTWLSDRPDPANALNIMYSHASLETAEILDVEDFKGIKVEALGIDKGEVICDILISVKVNGIVQVRKPRIIKESEAYEPDIDGDWGVNPISMLREIK